MGMNFELLDGERIITLATNDVEADRKEFADMIQRKLGFEARKEMLELFEEPECEDWEGIADGYFQELLSAADEVETLRDELGDILDGKRLSRDRLEKLYKAIANAAKQIRFNT